MRYLMFLTHLEIVDKFFIGVGVFIIALILIAYLQENNDDDDDIDLLGGKGAVSYTNSPRVAAIIATL